VFNHCLSPYSRHGELVVELESKVAVVWPIVDKYAIELRISSCIPRFFTCGWSSRGCRLLVGAEKWAVSGTRLEPLKGSVVAHLS